MAEELDSNRKMSVLEPLKEQSQDIVQKITGSFGRYQLFLCFILAFTKYFVATSQQAILFLAPEVTYTCQDGGSTLSNVTGVCPCQNPVYDTSVFSRTIVTEWNLICDRNWLISFHQSMCQFGVLLGSVGFGVVSDRYGRRTSLLIAVTLQTITGIIAGFVNNYWAFTVLRFLVGLSVGGTTVVGYVVLMEFIGTKHRTLVSSLFHIPYSLGYLTLPALAYFFRDFSEFQLSIAVPTALMLSYYIFVPETPRWLLALKKNDQAIRVLEKVAKTNNRSTENIVKEVENYRIPCQKKRSIIDLFKTPNIRKNILIMSFNWLTGSYFFYGLSQWEGQLGDNQFVNVAASSGLTLVGFIIFVPFIKCIPRKIILISSYLLCIVCLTILTLIEEGIWSVIVAGVGVGAGFINFIILYLYCAELFPTVIRNAAMGFASMSARIGAMLAPFIIDTKPVARWLPSLLFAVLPVIAIFLTLLLPETIGRDLMNTMEEGESFGKKNNRRPSRDVEVNT